ncbi:flagellar hook-length control protein FliK [Massilia haematophila]|uniref:Flagellar hook-length control protein FliK n=1 Tax=Massilia haematophila TaxID=457923 RepID=A0ABV7PTK3_9BURK
MMNLNLTNLNLPAAGKGAKPAEPGAAAGNAATVKDAAAAAQPGEAAQAPAQPALAFAEWLGLDQPLPPPAADGLEAPAADESADEQQPADNALLGAMAMPLMPAAQATLAAVVAALPGVRAPKDPAPAADTGISPAPDAAARVDLRTANAGAALPALSDAAMPATTTPATGQQKNTAPALAADAFGGVEAGQDQAPTGDRGLAQAFGVAAPANGAAQRGADTVTLSGPPTAWRQTLHEALGERLQLQLGKNAEQAVIRLEPPMLGRVEIAIRHSAGSLEVHISATHGEVLRQLQSVSENLRNDLAQRQFTDVAVNITQAARSANAAPQFAGDGGNRGRQQDGQQQEQAPGNALAEANDGASAFSLNARA